jgi:hypothetical protein
MANMQSFCFNIAFHNFATLENRLTYQCPSSWPVVNTMKKKLAGTWKKNIGYWPVQMNGNKFATDQILQKTGRSCEGAGFSWLSSKVLPNPGYKRPIQLVVWGSYKCSRVGQSLKTARLWHLGHKCVHLRDHSIIFLLFQRWTLIIWTSVWQFFVSRASCVS